MTKKYSVEDKHVFKSKERTKDKFFCDIVKIIYNYKSQTRKVLIETFNSNGYEKYERDYDTNYKDYWLDNGCVEVFNK